eukprot:588834-Karenia_brevis.AAC.1
MKPEAKLGETGHEVQQGMIMRNGEEVKEAMDSKKKAAGSGAVATITSITKKCRPSSKGTQLMKLRKENLNERHGRCKEKSWIHSNHIQKDKATTQL